MFPYIAFQTIKKLEFWNSILT